jgi:hypothetical protein
VIWFRPIEKLWRKFLARIDDITVDLRPAEERVPMDQGQGNRETDSGVFLSSSREASVQIQSVKRLGSDLFVAILAQFYRSILQFNPNLIHQSDPLMQ